MRGRASAIDIRSKSSRDDARVESIDRGSRAAQVPRMDLKTLRSTWNAFGERDPMWAILTDAEKQGGRWNREEFFATGRAQVQALRTELATLGVPLAFRRALDVGCGVGRVTQARAWRYEEVGGVGVAPSRRARGE